MFTVVQAKLSARSLMMGLQGIKM